MDPYSLPANDRLKMVMEAAATEGRQEEPEHLELVRRLEFEAVAEAAAKKEGSSSS